MQIFLFQDMYMANILTPSGMALMLIELKG